ncbi:MAG: phosphoglycerate kinase [Alphaproteobacteria bacterium]|jgi:phosphoglycerate kinase
MDHGGTVFKTLDDCDVSGKRVLVRVDLNVPVMDGRVSDMTRIERVAPTLRELSDKGAKVVVLSHFDRPGGKVVPEMSLASLAKPLADVLGRDVAFAKDCIGSEAAHVVEALAPGGVALLENLRFHGGEEANDAAFSSALADLGDLYVNDAFSAAHRAHGSIEGLTHHLPSFAGRLMQAELEALRNALETPEHPVAAIVGGSKVSSKLDLLGNLSTRVDKLVIGGGMANTFLFAKGINVGASLCERDMADTARAILARAEDAGCDILLPIDVVIASGLKDGANAKTVGINDVPADAMILDVGILTAKFLCDALSPCKTVVWNGPLGAFEFSPFDTGTTSVARHVATLTQSGDLLSVAGGGDTVAALAKAGAGDHFSYVSTAGGAFLEWLEGKELPGVRALVDAAKG